jgi:hypothetical protein
VYPARVPALSAEAVHARLIWLDETAVAFRLVGTEGGVAGVGVDPDPDVVPVALLYATVALQK